jgi:L,D-peptidoglycan transpeptidase YkuD (ErfK/YbiS/YcfS/YnhG family)
MQVAGSAARRNGRVLRAMALLGVMATAVGICSGAAGPPSVLPAPQASFTAPAIQEFSGRVSVDASLLRFQLPRGYGTIAERAAQEAARAAEAAAAATAAAAAADEQAIAAEDAPVGGTGQGLQKSAPVTAAASPSSDALPLGVDPGGSDQVVTVVAASAGSTTARLTAWQRGPTGWTAVLGPVTARVGSAGVGRASESSTRTPAGTFTLTEAFGRAGNPGTGLPYRVVDGDDWWVSDVSSPRYNQYAQCAPGTCDFNEQASENLHAAGGVYDHAVVIDYNRGGTPGAGSAFFLHIGNGAATAGCVAIDAGSLGTLLRWLNPAARPVISIGVG